MSGTAIFRGMDRATLDAAYNNSAAVTDSPEWVDRWRTRSVSARASQGAKSGIRLDIPYGALERTKFDYFPAGAANAPLLVFIHGGYWVRNSYDMFAFLTAGPNAHGINFASIGYTLAPQARLSQIFAETGQCLTYLADHADELGFDRNNIFVTGWSAGGHLAAMMIEHAAVRGALPISGIFDLEPLSLNYINDALQFTKDDIEKLSPLRRLGKTTVPMRLVAGGNELPELQRQTRDYAEAARALSLKVSNETLPGHHHFSILDELAKPDGLITRELLKLIAETSDK
ncbi:MAG: alpha/beta hydrolase [Xanthobacteraceae bacterium]|nr:alpha/beta hydrolase [Xanthobacteraceae bacterium]